MKNFYAIKSQTFFATLTLLLFSVSIFSQTTYNITDPKALEDQTYVAGDVIILANGTYNTDERFSTTNKSDPFGF